MPFILKELLFAAGASALSLLFIIQSFRLTDSAALLPRLLAGLIMILSVVLAVQSWNAHRRMILAGRKEEIPPVNIRLVSAFLLIIIGYVVMIHFLGYFIATPVFIIGSYLFLRAMSGPKAVLVACAFCALVYGVFVRILHLPVPLGLLETILE